MTPLLEARGVCFSHAKRIVLDGISLAAGSGEFIALTGRNGAGKSTLMDVLAGLREPSAGEVLVAGRLRAQWTRRELARRISHLPQTLDAALPFTAAQVAAMGRYPHTDSHFESPADRRAVHAAMERTGCAAFAARPFSTLSGGERQRVLLAASLAQDAPVLLLDEPGTFLDIGAQLDCFALLADEAAHGRLCLAVTHDLNLALAHCTRLLILDSGRIAHDLTIAQVAEDAAATGTAAWLGAFSSRLRLHLTDSGSPRVWLP